MKMDVLMPKLGESITEGTIVKWWKQPGDYIKKDETLLEISTDKVESEIPSPYEGVIAELKFKENETVAVDSVIASIDDAAAPGEAAPSSESKPASAAAAPAEIQAPQPQSAGAVQEVRMPQVGEGITEGTLVKWWKKPGDFVKKDETLLEISTDKVESEIPSPYEGVVLELLAKENASITVDSVIARIESRQGGEENQDTPQQVKPEKSVEYTSVAVQGNLEQKTADSDVLKRKNGGRFYSPLVLNIARKEGIAMSELQHIEGSGNAGRVTKKDILAYIATRKTAAARPEKTAGRVSEAAFSTMPGPINGARKAVETPSAKDVTEKWSGKSVEVIPMDAIRRKIADHMVMSKATSPHVYGVAECDFSKVIHIVNTHRAAFLKREGFKLTINPFILFSITKAVKDFPGVNSSVEGYNVIQKRYLNIGMAVATEKGLIVPTLKNADQLNFVGIARSAYDLAIRARDGKLNIEDVQGATFTVTNYGVFGNVIGSPIINQPNVAILGVGAVKKRPVVIESESGDLIGIRSIGFLTLSYDHRVVDGELGDKFLQRVNHYLQNFDENWL